MTEFQDLIRRVGDYYAEKLRVHGANAHGVDWNSAESQVLRFRQLLRLHEEHSQPLSINDYGCGYGALVSYLEVSHYQFTYSGYDVAEEMITQARKIYADLAHCAFYPSPNLRSADYTVASGIFNVRFDTPDGVWKEYLLATLEKMWAISGKGMAFNALTSYSDTDKKRPDLYYADPCVLFDHCKRHFSRHVALLHDYGLWEFTILVRR